MLVQPISVAVHEQCLRQPPVSNPTQLPLSTGNGSVCPDGADIHCFNGFLGYMTGAFSRQLTWENVSESQIRAALLLCAEKFRSKSPSRYCLTTTLCLIPRFPPLEAS